MAITTSHFFEHQNYGAISSNETSIQWMWQSVWRWSNLHESWRLDQYTTLGWTSAPTQLSPENSPSKIGMIWMLNRAPARVWCDYCKTRWGTESLRGQTPAVWQIVTKRGGRPTILRNYCHPCTMEIQTWPDGSLWTLHEQIDYAKGIQKLDVQFE